MAQTVKVWFDKAGDFPGVRFSEKPSFMRETDHVAAMQRVNAQGEVLGFTVMAVSRLGKDHPLVPQLTTSVAAR